MPTDPIVFSDIILPTPDTSLSTLLNSLKKSSITLTNRLHSIYLDAAFVSRVADAYGRPLVANERCGSWYVEGGRRRESGYFKSTDGHTGAWKMSMRRLNIHLVGLIEKNDGIIIVDSTRRGKKMPDALSKTIPIWCTVLNTLLFPNHPHPLHTPPTVVSLSETSSITALLPIFTAALTSISTSLDIPLLRQKITKPLRPLWVTPDTSLPESPPGVGGIFEGYRPIICCTASARSVGGELGAEGYVQGAADDMEMWAHGLTADIFWKHKNVLLATGEAELLELIEKLVLEESLCADGKGFTEVTNRILVGQLGIPNVPTDTACISLTPDSTPIAETPTTLSIGINKHKSASRNLRTHLPVICTFATTYMHRNPRSSITILCESGKDISVGVALAIDCWVFNDEGSVKNHDERQEHTKTTIRAHLGKIIVKYPGVNPSRNTLQSVNSFLMG